jgi:hypothetical protein
LKRCGLHYAAGPPNWLPAPFSYEIAPETVLRIWQNTVGGIPYLHHKKSPRKGGLTLIKVFWSG